MNIDEALAQMAILVKKGDFTEVGTKAHISATRHTLALHCRLYNAIRSLCRLRTSATGPRYRWVSQRLTCTWTP